MNKAFPVRICRYACMLLCLVVLFSAFPAAHAETAEPELMQTPEPAADAYAENLTDQCAISSDLSSTAFRYRLTDSDYKSVQHLNAGVTVTLSWQDDVPVKAVYLAFKDEPQAYSLQQYDGADKLLSETEGDLTFYNVKLDVLPAARRVTLVPRATVSLCAFYAYGAGEVPNYHAWEPTPEKADYLVIVMHPDDDVLFMGAVLPLYAVEQGRAAVLCYLATRERVRKDEALNGAWAMGLREMPILGDFPDIPPGYYDQFKHTFPKADVIRYAVQLIRQVRPEVVVSQDLNGEYGHWQHKIMADAVYQAVPLAADASYDPESAAAYGVWEVKKLYLHLYPENKITLPATEPMASFGGRTAVEVAEEAFQCHQSQLPSKHSVTNEGVYSMSDFGLAYTTVGTDTPGVNDIFEHIPEEILRTNATPTPTPTPTPAPTPTFVPTSAPTHAPTSAPDAQTDGQAGDGARTRVGILILAGAVVLAGAAFFLFRRRRKTGGTK